jgi:alkylated DNA repair dioxygenase AlkB
MSSSSSSSSSAARAAAVEPAEPAEPAEPPAAVERAVDARLGLDVALHRGWLSREARARWWRVLTEKVRWHRVKYKSRRFRVECETPCWTTFYGGDPAFRPFAPVPGWLAPLVGAASRALLGEGNGTFNAILVRLYFDGADEIAWHTDGRKFLGREPTIGSLSLGAGARFEMRRMHNCWPCVGGAGGAAAGQTGQTGSNSRDNTSDNTSGGRSRDDGVDRDTPKRSWKLTDGDLFVMRGKTQQFWHHRVPKEKGRRPRININFRMILPGRESAERGQKSYYKYMVHGDNPKPPSWTFDQLLRKSNSLLRMFSGGSAASASQTTRKSNKRPAASDISPAAPTPAAPTFASASACLSSTSWDCPRCTLINAPASTRCEACGHQITGSADAADAAGSSAAGNGNLRKKKAKTTTTLLDIFHRAAAR